MKAKLLTALLLSLFCVLGLHAQHSATLTFTPSTTVGVNNYNVYRAPCNGTVSAGACSIEGIFALIGTAPGTATSYKDTTVLGGYSYVYYLTAVCTTACGTDASGNKITGESVPSNHWAGTIPATSPQPPAILTLTSASLQRTGSNATFAATWIDSPNTNTTWSLTYNGKPFANGAQGSTTGNYAMNWSGKLNPQSTPIVFTVCDTQGTCASQRL